MLTKDEFPEMGYRDPPFDASPEEMGLERIPREGLFDCVRCGQQDLREADQGGIDYETKEPICVDCAEEEKE